ncbi:SDR family NAD(P)-dependent oxidoreductase [Pseudorhodoplanes sp.]|uniref:SDR family NAD(P)-dependent oxidoreductase n=1 Tax=Pseudorhodoplanes sp. TaxID=1934341 RepID=UPI003D151467
MRPEGHVAVVAGGASGIGFETAEALAKQGAKGTMFDINADTCRTDAAWVGAIALVCDVESVGEALAATVGSFNILRFVAAEMVRPEAGAEGERGIIINTASIAACEGQVGKSAYAAPASI